MGRYLLKAMTYPLLKIPKKSKSRKNGGGGEACGKRHYLDTERKVTGLWVFEQINSIMIVLVCLLTAIQEVLI